MVLGNLCWLQVLVVLPTFVSSDDNSQHHHHHHHRHHHRGVHNSSVAQVATHHSSGLPTAPAQEPRPQQAAHPRRHARMVAAPQASGSAVSSVDLSHGVQASDEQILQKIKHLEKELGAKEHDGKAANISFVKGHLNVNGPLPTDFSDRFAQGVADATGCQSADVELVGAVPASQAGGTVEEIMFRSRTDVVAAVEDQAANPESKLATGVLHSFLVARDEPEDQDPPVADKEPENDEEPEKGETPEAPEVDMSMPYGDLEPFGREDTAQELTESSIRESNAMVDQLEKSEVAEEKRAVFRALTRLRGAAITSYDGIARSQTGNIDDYARTNQWRKAHPVHHLADDEADVSKWAFPDSDDEQD